MRAQALPLSILTALVLVAVAAPVLAQGGMTDDHPVTVYEAPDVPPQAMDYDTEDQRFIAHPGWVNDQSVHYYKFRMYVPPNYAPGAAADVPIIPVFLPSTDGTFDGVPDGQHPILRNHTGSGADWDRNYSDFVRIYFVDVPMSYTANSHRSVADLERAGYTATDSGIVANVPVVPTGSTLQDPADPSEDAPITPWMAWWDGHEVQTFAFESTSQDFADFINPLTRTGSAAEAGSGYEATVAPSMVTGANGDTMTALPIWHINQLFTGVTPGVNNGGPAAVGQRNVISHDRLDPGYSPLWQVFWVQQVPVGYEADQASHPGQFTPANGFRMALTPMFVNCPNIGPHGGGATNDLKADHFHPTGDVNDGDVAVEGALIMRGDRTVALNINGEQVATHQTGMMGGFRFDVPTDRLESGTNQVTVTYEDATLEGPYQEAGAVVASWDIEGPQEGGNTVVVVLVIVALAAALFYVYRRTQPKA